uniref:Uncharacterized protein n=1 Tax=Brassica oleracea TaxID=3712 RepID=A0A3P6F0K0_BRAOL|nr:unnamed protein product [Brassica oleracea]
MERLEKGRQAKMWSCKGVNGYELLEVRTQNIYNTVVPLATVTASDLNHEEKNHSTTRLSKRLMEASGGQFSRSHETTVF